MPERYSSALKLFEFHALVEKLENGHILVTLGGDDRMLPKPYGYMSLESALTGVHHLLDAAAKPKEEIKV